jgi:hypothetical protein
MSSKHEADLRALSVIRLDTPDWIPADLRARLESHEAAFRAAEFRDDIKDGSWYRDLEAALQDAANGRSVIAYHCTREFEPGEIARRGLRVLRDCHSHRAEVFERVAANFTSDQRIQINNRLAQVQHDDRYTQGRENGLFFALVHPRHWGEAGCGELLGTYGGEVVYSVWGRRGPIVDRLRTIGQPAVVHFQLDPTLIKGFADYPVGQTAMWARHTQLRPDVRNYWCEGRTTVDVPPSDIVSVENWSPGDA